jgi:hypothetical protein
VEYTRALRTSDDRVITKFDVWMSDLLCNPQEGGVDGRQGGSFTITIRGKGAHSHDQSNDRNLKACLFTTEDGALGARNLEINEWREK